ncbi:MAG: hypothetical protein AB8B80_00285 [Marinicellaceae bacterium]
MQLLKTKLISLIILLWVSMAQASEAYQQEVNHQWGNLSQADYISNRMACEYKLQQLKWSKNIWPKEKKDLIYDVNNNFKFKGVKI